MKAAQGGAWQAAAWRLERMRPDHWGRKDRLEHSGGLRLTKLTDDELARELARLRED